MTTSGRNDDTIGIDCATPRTLPNNPAAAARSDERDNGLLSTATTGTSNSLAMRSPTSVRSVTRSSSGPASAGASSDRRIGVPGATGIARGEQSPGSAGAPESALASDSAG